MQYDRGEKCDSDSHRQEGERQIDDATRRQEMEVAASASLVTAGVVGLGAVEASAAVDKQGPPEAPAVPYAEKT